MHALKQNHGLTVLTKCVICRRENVNQITVSVAATCSCRVQINFYVLILGASTGSDWFLSVFSGVRTVLTALPGSYLLQKLWIENSVPSS